jgi:hypothetical protein
MHVMNFKSASRVQKRSTVTTFTYYAAAAINHGGNEKKMSRRLHNIIHLMCALWLSVSSREVCNSADTCGWV